MRAPLFALVGLLLGPASMAAQTLGPLKFSGFAEASYAYSGHSSGDTIIVGRLYDRLQSRFTLNAFGIVLDKPYDAAKRSAGLHAEVLFGQNATVIKSGGGALEWDQVSDNNKRKSLMGRVGISPDAHTSIGVTGFWGPEQTDNDQANRYGVEALIWRKLGTAQLWVQGDYGREQANAALPTPTEDAQWWALGGWMTFDLDTSLGLALRGDYVNDENGARTSGSFGFPANGGQKLGSTTATLNVRAWPNAIVRPEIRYDRSTLAAFNGKQAQVTFALAVTYLY